MRLPLLTILIAAAALGVHAAGYAQALQYDRGCAGELWRFATAQLTHFSLDHLLWDVLVFVTLGTCCERHDRRSFGATVLASMVLVPLAVHLGCTQIRTFRGLSGVDSALFGLLLSQLLAAATRARRQGWRLVAGLGVAAFIGKCAFEQLTGRTLFADSAAAGFVAVPLAHAVGFVCGLLVPLALGDLRDVQPIHPWVRLRARVARRGRLRLQRPVAA